MTKMVPRKYLSHFLLICCLCFAVVGLPLGMNAQTTSQTSFGKNRVQYNRQIDEWMIYETPNWNPMPTRGIA